MAQTSGPRDGRADGHRLAEHNGQQGPRRQRSYEWQDPAVSAAAAPAMAGIDFFRALLDGELPVPPIASTLALAQARLTDGQGKLYAHATSSCLIFRP